MPKTAILGLFLQINSTKRPTFELFHTPEPPKRYKPGHFIWTVIIWGLWCLGAYLMNKRELFAHNCKIKQFFATNFQNLHVLNSYDTPKPPK